MHGSLDIDLQALNDRPQYEITSAKLALTVMKNRFNPLRDKQGLFVAVFVLF